MRTFGLSLGVAMAASSFLAPSQLPAQQTVRSSGDYSLAIVSAVIPSEAEHAASDVVTLVIENRGTIKAPVSMVSVAPRNHLSLARQTAIPALAPGERTTIRLPVVTAADGTDAYRSPSVRHQLPIRQQHGFWPRRSRIRISVWRASVSWPALLSWGIWHGQGAPTLSRASGR